MHDDCKEITELILKAAEAARNETSNEPESSYTQHVSWPVTCTVGPGLEGAIACESSVGYVNGSKGWLVYRGYDIFDLCAYSTFEEVSFLLIHGHLPTAEQLAVYKQKLMSYRYLPNTMRLLMSFPLEEMNTMASLRLGTLLMRQKQTIRDKDKPDSAKAISSDEDSIAMEVAPFGEPKAIYEFKNTKELEASYHLTAGVATLAAAISRIRQGKLPLEPDPELGHAANFLYMLTGRKPTPIEERVMDVALILHADHGMNASTFACMVVASTLSDVYFSIGAGIEALNGPLHGGANEEVLRTLLEIQSPDNVKPWFEKARAEKKKIMGFGHRVYKAYDPRARILGPLAKMLVKENPEVQSLYDTAAELEKQVVSTLGAEKKIFPNVDFFSGLVYSCLGIPPELYTPVFAVSRVSGWTARVLEYLENNRIFRPRAMYVGEFGKQYQPLDHPSREEESRQFYTEG